MVKSKSVGVIAKPTHDCNLRCKYCYTEESAEDGRMSERVLDLSADKISDAFKKSKWIWHGGEPLLMGVDFYRQVRDVQKHYSESKGVKFENSIQTNGTLITEDLLDFIEESKDFHLGMSLDGPEYLHNQTRIFRNGRGSFKRVMRGLNLAKRRNKKGRGRIGGGVICVISSQNIRHPKELYYFFKENGIDVKFNPLVKSGRAIGNLKELGITPGEYGEFLEELWEIYNSDALSEGEARICIDPFSEVIGNMVTRRPLGCNYSESCRDTFISIGPQGDIYPCGRFDGVKEFRIGNIKTHTIQEAVDSEINRELRKRGLETVAGCRDCEDGEVCNSGCMHNAYSNGDVMGRDPYCRSYKTLFKKMKEVLKEEEALQNVC